MRTLTAEVFVTLVNEGNLDFSDTVVTGVVNPSDLNVPPNQTLRVHTISFSSYSHEDPNIVARNITVVGDFSL